MDRRDVMPAREVLDLDGLALSFLGGDTDSALALEEGLATLSALRAAGRLPGRARLDRIRDRLLEEHALPVRLRDLAEREGLHPAHLARAFRQAFGRSMGEYRREVRLAAARSRLDSGWSIADAAADAGFADQSHLTRTFRAELGITPGTYRRAKKETFSIL